MSRSIFSMRSVRFGDRVVGDFDEDSRLAIRASKFSHLSRSSLKFFLSQVRSSEDHPSSTF